MTGREYHPGKAARRFPVTVAAGWLKRLSGLLVVLAVAGGARPALAQEVQISCPPDQVVVADRTNASASLNPGTATSTTAGVTIFGVRSDGRALTDPYPVGVTTITWTATDGTNQNTCTQTITVEPLYVVPTYTSVVTGPGSANPHIDGLTPDHGPLNQRVIVRGTGFADLQGTSYVLFGGRQVPVLAWSAGAISIVIKPFDQDNAPLALNASYPVQVITPASGKQSNSVSFLLTDASPPDYPNPAVPGPSDQPSFECFQRHLFCPGDTVSFLGAGFGLTQGTGYVTVDVPLMDSMGNVAHQTFVMPVIFWSENVVSFLLSLPGGAIPGTYTATVHRGNGKTASGSFVVGVRDSSGNCIAAAQP
jgi:hypothetical protein